MNTKPIICYPKEKLKPSNLPIYQEARKNLKVLNEVIIHPRDAKCFKVQAGQFFRIENINDFTQLSFPNSNSCVKFMFLN